VAGQVGMASDGLATTVYGLGSAVIWGAGDFCGGYATKRTGVYGVVAASQTIGLMVLLAMALVTLERAPTATELAWSSLAGLCSGLGLVFYYRALSGGSMGSSAPVTGVVTAAVPALTGFLFEGAPSPLQTVGFALAIIAIAQVTGLSRKNLTPNKQLIRSLLAGIFFGLFLIFLGQVSQDSYLYPLSITRVVTIAMALAMAYVSGGPKIPQTAAPLAVGAGVFDSMGSLLYLLARHAGRLDVAGVLSSLYPVSTVVLAKTILKEPISPRKAVGIAFATAAAAALYAG
jgi:drug/metabolite transporter (DMT)-like permease